MGCCCEYPGHGGLLHPGHGGLLHPGHGGLLLWISRSRWVIAVSIQLTVGYCCEYELLTFILVST